MIVRQSTRRSAGLENWLHPTDFGPGQSGFGQSTGHRKDHDEPGEISEPADQIEQSLELRIHQDRPFAAFIDLQRKPGNVRLFPGARDGDFILDNRKHLLALDWNLSHGQLCAIVVFQVFQRQRDAFAKAKVKCRVVEPVHNQYFGSRSFETC